MTTPRLNLLVLRSNDPSLAVKFYSQLGLNFQEEQHGRGPVHWAAELGGLVLEIYAATESQPVDASTRLGFAVADVKEMLQKFTESEIVSPAKDSPWGERAVIRDPDGRSVELLGSK